jgi:hypothetical protein
MIEKDKKEIKGYIKKLFDYFDKQVKKIDKNSDNRVQGYIENVNDRFKATNEGYSSINEKLDKMQGDIDNITLELRDTKLKVQDISYNTNITLDKKIDKKLFLDLDNRVRVLEKA